MSDARLRELERAVARGEAGAVAALQALRLRRGLKACGHDAIYDLVPGMCFLCRPEGTVLLGRLDWRTRRKPGMWHLVYFRQRLVTPVASCRWASGDALEEFKWGLPRCMTCGGRLVAARPEHVARVQAFYAGLRHEVSDEDRKRGQMALFA